jgi:DNA-directed RNA polymerase subunit F
MIKDIKPLSMAESIEYVKDKDSEILKFAKKFIKLTPEKAKDLRTKIESLNLMKLNDKHISKIIDLVPQDKEELNKIFADVSLDETESNVILETIKGN